MILAISTAYGAVEISEDELPRLTNEERNLEYLVRSYIDVLLKV